MGYIQCKHCGAQMSDKSEACPVCGTPVDGAMPPELPTEQNNEQLQNKPFNKLLVLGVVGGIALVGIIVAIAAFVVVEIVLSNAKTKNIAAVDALFRRNQVPEFIACNI